MAAGDAGALAGKRVGLIANPSSIDGRLRHAADLLAADPAIGLVRLFGPEHGIRGAAQDMITVDGSIDERTGLPVVSLYGSAETLAPSVADLDGLDALVFDLQDVGARYYTYVWTLVLSMRVAAEAGVALVVLDRPNPLGGALVEGPAIEPGFESFIGLCSVPNRHGLTAGELARLIRSRESIDVDLDVVELEGWQRSMFYDQTGLPWVLPSPNMPTLETAIVYPGMCLLEGTELSEGRGTTRPFEVAGAPFIDGYALAGALDAEGLPGLALRPLSFLPTFQKHSGAMCGGVQLHVTDRGAYPTLRAGVAFIRAVRQLYPDDFVWRTRAYEFVDAIPAFDLLAGGASLREGIDAGAPLADLCAGWAAHEAAFRAERAPHLLY